ncbi:MAG: hypothetical protein FWD16_06620 [Clostridia bacterium]|nr:hypothetical protein [Clostridia bacterium]
MKKLLAITLALLLACTLAACSIGNSNRNPSPNPNSSPGGNNAAVSVDFKSIQYVKNNVIITLGESQEAIEAKIGTPVDDYYCDGILSIEFDDDDKAINFMAFEDKFNTLGYTVGMTEQQVAEYYDLDDDIYRAYYTNTGKLTTLYDDNMMYNTRISFSDGSFSYLVVDLW